MDVFEHIKNNVKYPCGDAMEVYNLWISYFNNDTSYTSFITGKLLDLIRSIDFMDNLNYFYTLAISIFIIERAIMNIMTREETGK